MDFLFELFFQVFGEALLQVLAEAFFEIGLDALGDTLKREKHPALSTLGYALWGGIAGIISLVFLPKSMVTSHALKLVCLILIPLMSGIAIVLFGQLRGPERRHLARPYRFCFAVAFTFVMSLVRFRFLS